MTALAEDFFASLAAVGREHDRLYGRIGGSVRLTCHGGSHWTARWTGHGRDGVVGGADTALLALQALKEALQDDIDASEADAPAFASS